MKRQMRLLVAWMVVLSLFSLTGCGEEKEAPEIIRPVLTMKIDEAQVRLTGRTFPGKAKPREEVNLAFRIPGTLHERPVDVGTRVKKGDLVARLDLRDFEVRVENVAGQLNKARAEHALAIKDFNRVMRIFERDPGAISQAVIDNEQAALDHTRALVHELTAKLDHAKDDLGYCFLKAPYDGEVVKTFVEVFEDVQAKQPIVRIVDNSKIEFVIDVPERLIAHSDYVEELKVEFDAFPGVEVPATIWEIAREASPATRTFAVTLLMDHPEGIKLLPGMAGRAWVSKTSKEIIDPSFSGLTIPFRSVFSKEEQGYVWIVDEETMTVTSREVDVERIVNEGAVIRGGLNEGDIIVTAGADFLVEGQKVKFETVDLFNRIVPTPDVPEAPQTSPTQEAPESAPKQG